VGSAHVPENPERVYFTRLFIKFFCFFLLAQTFSLKEKLYQQTFFHKESLIKETYIFSKGFCLQKKF